MFRVFLKEKLPSSKTSQGASGNEMPNLPPAERRRYERYDMDYKHLTLLNDADILNIREISAQGFSAEVSPRCFDRLNKDDVYNARMRYMGECYNLTARVAWKAGSQIGFQIKDAESPTQLFLRRLLQVAKIGNSLTRSDQKIVQPDHPEIIREWFYGPDDASLYVWLKESTGSVIAWQLSVESRFIEWSDSLGVVTGHLSSSMVGQLRGTQSIDGAMLHADATKDPEKVKFALDILMALRDPIRDQLLATLTTNDEGPSYGT